MVQRVIVTRVQPHAERWIQALIQAGYDAQALPLIEFAEVHDRGVLRTVWQAAQTWQAVMFVSSQAVDALVAKIGKQGVSDHLSLGRQAPRLWCTGPGTRACLLGHGFHADLIDAPPEQGEQFDSEALWSQVSQQVGLGARVLVVRGDSPVKLPGSLEPALSASDPGAGVGRDWLARQLEAAQAQVEFVVAYARCLPDWSPLQSRLARSAACDGSIWLFSSAQGVRNLIALLPKQDWSAAHALCTHPRIEQAAKEMGFSRIVACLPTLANVLVSLKSAS